MTDPNTSNACVPCKGSGVIGERTRCLACDGLGVEPIPREEFLAMLDEIATKDAAILRGLAK